MESLQEKRAAFSPHGHESTENLCKKKKGSCGGNEEFTSSMIDPIEFKDKHLPGHSRSMKDPIEFRHLPGYSRDLQEISGVSSDQFSQQQHRTGQDDIHMALKEHLSAFMENELTRLLRALREDEDVLDNKEEEQNSREAFLTITLDILRRKLKNDEMADLLQSKILSALGQTKLKSHLMKDYEHFFERANTQGNKKDLNHLYTDLLITDGGTRNIKEEHEIIRIEAAFRQQESQEKPIKLLDIFESTPGKACRIIMMRGVAGIGKTVLTKKVILDWAKNDALNNIDFIFPLKFRHLNQMKAEKYSLVGLLNHFFPEIQQAELCRFEDLQVLFIMTGLDEYRFPLDFYNNETLTDVTQSASVDVVLTNLIRGRLLPSARLWITTRPAAASRIPTRYVDTVLDVHGFDEHQKKEYFKKKFSDETMAKKVISHIKKSQSLNIMCHIPAFCWITAAVLEEELKTKQVKELPKTLTEMYIHFLVVQLKSMNAKYLGGAEAHWNPESSKMIESLGKLAFTHLNKKGDNLIFYESDLEESGVDITAASVHSGVFSMIFKEIRGLYQTKLFYFVHASFQEFVAALYVFQTFREKQFNLLTKEKSTWTTFYKRALEKAQQSPNGHLDLFLRFLFGLSLKANQDFLKDILKLKDGSSETSKEIVDCIKQNITEIPQPEKSINLFHCLNELHDHSLEEEVKQYQGPGGLTTDKLSPAHWSALVFTLLSEKDLDKFVLKKYFGSDEALLKLMPVVKAFKKALLSGCNLSKRSCKALATVLNSQSSNLRELDLSNNTLCDSGVKRLCDGLKNTHCKLKTLRLADCQITQEGCKYLFSALKSNPSHLRVLDLSNNKLRDTAVNCLSTRGWKLLI